MKTKIFLLLISLTGCVNAGTVTGKITHIFSGPGFGSKVFIAIDTIVTNKPSCQANTLYAFSLDSETVGSDIWLSMLLTAYSTGKTVYLEGSNQCNLWSNIEDLKYIRLNP